MRLTRSTLKSKAVQHTPKFPGHFFLWEHYSPHARYESVKVELTHDIDIIDFAPNFSASTFKSYAEVGQAYQVRAKEKAKVTPAIQTLANELIEKAKAKTTLEKVKLMHHWVAQNIRYLGIYVGAGGYVPHDAQSILDNRYGDCKDHVVLLEALLAAAGIDSSPALINSGAAFLLPQLPTPGIFDHVITYVPSLNVFLDSTSRFAPLGTLPNGDLDKPVNWGQININF